MTDYTSMLFAELKKFTMSFTDWVWNMINGGASFGAFIFDHWVTVLVTVIIAGVVLDYLIWLIRWRPYRLWFASIVRRRRGNLISAEMFEGKPTYEADDVLTATDAIAPIEDEPDWEDDATGPIPSIDIMSVIAANEAEAIETAAASLIGTDEIETEDIVTDVIGTDEIEEAVIETDESTEASGVLTNPDNDELFGLTDGDDIDMIDDLDFDDNLFDDSFNDSLNDSFNAQEDAAEAELEEDDVLAEPTQRIDEAEDMVENNVYHSEQRSDSDEDYDDLYDLIDEDDDDLLELDEPGIDDDVYERLPNYIYSGSKSMGTQRTARRHIASEPVKQGKRGLFSGLFQKNPEVLTVRGKPAKRAGIMRMLGDDDEAIAGLPPLMPISRGYNKPTMPNVKHSKEEV